MDQEGLTAVVWKGKREVYMPSNMDKTPTDGNSCDERKSNLKPL
jgi:hypothetical protein